MKRLQSFAWCLLECAMCALAGVVVVLGLALAVQFVQAWL